MDGSPSTGTKPVTLLAHLQSCDPAVLDVVLESRTAVLDRRDARRIEGLRTSRRITEHVRYRFATKAEPLLWLADAVAGAASAEIAGDKTYADLLQAGCTRILLPGAP